MDKHLAQLHHERGRLLERIASQRIALSHQLQPLQKAAATGDRFASVLQRWFGHVKNHPLPALTVAAVLVLLRPNNAWHWAKRGWWVWRTWRTLRT